MESDCYFVQGRTHLVCQDYALTGPTWAVLSDGCSGSPHTDVGARILALCAREQLQLGPPDADLLIRVAASRAGALGLPAACLDATLMMAYLHEGSTHVDVYGDGVVAARRRDGEGTDLFIIRYTHNAPFYLSYRLSEERTAIYLRETNHGHHTITVREYFEPDGDGTTIEQGSECEPFKWGFHRDTYDLIALISDGAESFQKPLNTATGKGFEPVPTLDVVEHLTTIKGTKGQFVVRRVRRFLSRFCATNLWHHNDDLSMAALCVEEAPCAST